MTQKQEWFTTTPLSQGLANQSIVFYVFLMHSAWNLPHLLLRISCGVSVELNWACFECSSPARLFHLWGWLVPISRHIPNLKHIKIIWNIPLQLKILLKSTRFAYNDRNPPIGKAGGGDRWPSNQSQFGNWTCKINLWVDSVELNR